VLQKKRNDNEETFGVALRTTVTVYELLLKNY